MTDTQQSDSTAGAEGQTNTTAGAPKDNQGVKLNGIFAHKLGMSQVYAENGEQIPVTVLKMDAWVVSQVKTIEKDGYAAIQVAGHAKKAVNTSMAEKGHLKKAGFENGAHHIAEFRMKDGSAIPAGATVGAKISIESLAKGDTVRITSTSKGKGFHGSVRRWGFAGGPASHGSKFHRQPGSSGNRTWPGRVMPGKKFPGHVGDDTVTVRNVKIVDVLVAEGVILVKGPVPGSRNTLVKLVKE